MTTPTVEQLPVRVPGRTLRPHLIHVSCPVHKPHLTFCGIEVATLQRFSGGPASCVVCAELEESHNWAACLWGRS